MPPFWSRSARQILVIRSEATQPLEVSPRGNSLYDSIVLTVTDSNATLYYASTPSVGFAPGEYDGTLGVGGTLTFSTPRYFRLFPVAVTNHGQPGGWARLFLDDGP